MTERVSFFLFTTLLIAFSLASTSFQQTPHINNDSYHNQNYYELNRDMYVGVVWKGLHAFYWKESFNFTDSSTFVNFTQNNSFKIALVGDPDIYTMWSYYSKLYKLEHVQYTFIKTFVETCGPYHLVDDFDVIIALDSSFYRIVRRFNNGKRKPDGQVYNFMDFSSVYLDAPNQVFQWDSDNYVYSSYYSKPNCSDSVWAVSYYEGELHTLHNLATRNKNDSLLSEREVEFLKFVNSFDSLKTVSLENAELIRNGIRKHYGFDQNSSVEYYQSLFLLHCTCENSNCVEMTFSEFDYWIIPTAVLVIVHFLVLFISKSFLTPSLKSRLLLPYLPFIVLYLEIEIGTWIRNLCPLPRLMIYGFVITFYIMIYSLTILRIYYLRNLYHLLSKNRKNIEKKLKFQRTLSGPLIGLVFTFFGGLLLSAFFSLPFYFLFNIQIDTSTYTNIVVGIYVGTACLVGLFSILIDLIFNRKKIKEKGLRFIFFFDDPYMIRIELILLSLIIICIILLSTIGYSHPSRLFMFIIYMCMVLISGGMATLKYIFNKILVLIRKNPNHHQTDDIDLLLKNSDFKDLLHDYCTKEMSLENFNIYILLMDMKEKAIVLDVDMMKNIEENYMALNSLFELNVPSSVRKEFYALLKEMESGEMKDSKSCGQYLDELILILKDPILQNLGDTLSRLETTKEFEIWNQIYSIQSKALQQ